MTVLALLCVPAVILGLTAVAAVIEPGLARRATSGRTASRRSSMPMLRRQPPTAGLNANTTFYI